MPNQPIVNSVSYRGLRSFHANAYHYCARCGSRVKIKEMQWQRGLLVCKTWDCIDHGNHGFPLVGQREASITSVLEVPMQELQPNEKLTSPIENGSSSEDDIIF